MDVRVMVRGYYMYLLKQGRRLEFEGGGSMHLKVRVMVTVKTLKLEKGLGQGRCHEFAGGGSML